MIRNLRGWAENARAELASLEGAQDLEERFGPYRHDLPAFFEQVLGLESATRRTTGEEYQLSILKHVQDFPRTVAVCGHGVGKSTVDAAAVLGWLVSRPYSKAVIVAPTFARQVRGVLFSEIRKLARRSLDPLPLRVFSDRVLIDGFGEEWGAIGMPATEPDRLEGVHAEGGVLLVLDESKGIPRAVYDSLLGALTGQAENRLLVTSTPGGPSGFLYDIVSKHRSAWRVHRIPSTESSLVDPQWVEDRRAEWGEESPVFQARVLGQFPEQAEDSLLSLSDLEAATQRSTGDGGKVVLGVDVARFGADRSVIARWRGNQLEDLEMRQGLDTQAVAAWVASYATRAKAEELRVDVVGVGAGVVDRLKALGRKNVLAYNSASRPANRELFLNTRAEGAWRFRESLERGEIGLPDHDGLISELSALRYRIVLGGQIKLESKEDLKPRLGRSPDLADACLIGWPGGIPAPPPIMIGRAGFSPRERRNRNLEGPHLLPAFDAGGNLIREV